MEWEHLLTHLAQRCSGPDAHDFCKRLPFLHREQARNWAELIAEFLVCFNEEDPPPILAAHPVNEALIHIRGEGLVPPESLLQVSVNLKLFSKLTRYIENRKDVCPKNATLILPAGDSVSPLTLTRIAAEIESSFEPDGTISDFASPELAKLRKRVSSIRENLLSKLDTIANNETELLRDKTITLRNDRFVIPVRNDAHRKIKGIVHGSSKTGATIFVEPEVTISAGNDLMLARDAVKREENRIIEELSQTLKQHLPEVEYACKTIVDTEVRIAAARLSHDLNATVPKPDKMGTMNLIEAKHPLLLLEGTKVVPNNISVKQGTITILSGPNAGGKTVILKTVGLLALMLSAGLPIPVDPDSSAGVPFSVLTNIGDDQSLENHLSTFSAHIKNVGEILNNAKEGSIVILDELCSGTDPIEGTALAESILAHLKQNNIATFTTTHFDALKLSAQSKEGFINCAMGFDPVAQKPTFKLKSGIPGSSSALAVAAQFNIPQEIINQAKSLLPKDTRKLNKAIEALEQAKRDAVLERKALSDERLATSKIQQQLNQKLQKLKVKQDKLLSRESNTLLNEIKRAREKVREAETRVTRRRATGASIKESRKKINDIAKLTAPGQKLSTQKASDLPGQPATAAQVIKGASVYVTTLGANAVVDSSLKGNTVYVQSGAIRIRVNLSELRVLSSQTPKTGEVPTKAQSKPKQHSPNYDSVIQTTDNTIDLRGKTADEGIESVDKFIDRAMLRNMDALFVIHGHGTGALRDAIRQHLSQSNYVEHFRPGEREEGGDGVTVVFLR